MESELRNTFLRAQLTVNAPEAIRPLIQFSSTFGSSSWDKIIDMLDKSSPINASGPSNSSNHDGMDTLIKSEPVEVNFAESRSSLNRSTQRNFEPRVEGRVRGECDYCHIYGHKSM